MDVFLVFAMEECCDMTRVYINIQSGQLTNNSPGKEGHQPLWALELLSFLLALLFDGSLVSLL
jgi:hypothetical protein